MTHGTRTAYHRGCRCVPCRAANARYEAARRLRQARGLVTAGHRIASSQVEAWLEALSARGVTRAQVAQALGLRRAGVGLRRRITLGRYWRIQQVVHRWIGGDGW